MFLIRAIPIAKSMGKDSLTYFSKEVFTPGNITTITVRNREISAIIQSVEPLSSEHRADIKSLPFIVKKIGESNEQPFFLPEFARCIEYTARYFATSQGALYHALTPQSILDNRALVVAPHTTSSTHHQSHHSVIFQSDNDTRIAHYKMLIREEFAKKQSVFMLVPTAHEALYYQSLFEKGIEQHVYALHGSLTKKETLRLWNAIITSPHPVLVIATGLFLSLPRYWSTIIIEHEHSRHYKMTQRPHLDMRTIAEALAQEMKALCIISDNMLRIETIHRYEQGELQELAEPQWRNVAAATSTLIDMQSYNKEKKDFVIISDELKELVQKNTSTNRHLFIYVARRGSGSQTICRDCGTTVLCNNCSAPVVHHTDFFLCHTCGTKRVVEDKCTTCGGWRLEIYGIGIEKVIKEIASIVGNHNVFRIDADTTPTRKKICAVIEEFQNTPGGILVGTDMALLYLNSPVEHVAVASLDSQFSIPDFRIKEKIFHTLLKLRSIASHELIVQTRYAALPLWDRALKGNLIDFYREELLLRKKYHYPPACTLIKISYTGSPTLVRTEMQHLKSVLQGWDVSIFPAFIEMKRGMFTMHASIRIARDSWPDPQLHSILRNLPLGYDISVDPENLL